MKRETNESFEDYKKRRKEFNSECKRKMEGTLIWNSQKNGTYRKGGERNENYITR